MPQTNAAAAGNGNGYTPRQKIAFATNKPQFITLEFDPPTEPKPGRYGDQFMYFLAGDRIAFLDPPAHDAIVRSGAKAGDELALTKTEVKHGNRRAIEWTAELVQEEPEEAAAIPTPAPPTPADAAMRSAIAATPVDADAQEMAAAIAAAVTACGWTGERYAIAWDRADIRALATTIYISRSKRGGRE